MKHIWIRACSAVEAYQQRFEASTLRALNLILRPAEELNSKCRPI